MTEQPAALAISYRRGGVQSVGRVSAIVVARSQGAKTRLSSVLSPEGRVALNRSMLKQVLRSLRAARGIERIVLVTSDESAAQAGVELVRDAGTGQSAAVETGLAHVAGTTDAAIVLAADTPGVSPREIEALIAALAQNDVVIAPDHRGEGTNALALRLPARMRMQFGVASLLSHLHSARELGARATILELTGLSRDIDLPEDLLDEPLPRELALQLAAHENLAELMQRASALTRRGFGLRVGYSRKVFIPLTQLCRDVCHYCTFAHPARRNARAFLTPEEILEIATAGVQAGCHEALFTLGDKPELRYAGARQELAALGFASTLDYLAHCARLVFEQTGLLAHLNAGVMQRADFEMLRPVSASMGLMLENISLRLMQRGGPHHRSPDKHPEVRLAAIRAAGEAAVPFTTGLLIGIGETRADRVESLLAIRELHEEYGHIQELIIQNFRAKPGTRMAGHPEPALQELLWTIAAARLIFGSTMSIQAPPNLTTAQRPALIDAGINDWGGVSPVTADHVNPEAPWPDLAALELETATCGRSLVQRLPIVPSFAIEGERWLDPSQRASIIRRIDAQGYVRDAAWSAGAASPPPPRYRSSSSTRAAGASRAVRAVLARVRRGEQLNEAQIVELFRAEGADFLAVIGAANALRREMAGDAVSYVVNRNINYTNICTYSCGFCAFAKGRSSKALRGPGYNFDLDEIARRVAEAADKGATEVCLQGGIHPSFTGQTYLDIVATCRRAAPAIHVHAFSPLEVTHGAETLELPLCEYLQRLREAGLSTLPGTAAEILCDDVRAVICPDKLSSAQWLNVMHTAHELGIRSTATIMFGHVEQPAHWARHLLSIRHLQSQTGGFTEFVPLPFVHMESPLWRAGRARSGPSFHEAILMHAVARLVLHPVIPNIQTSWVKMGVAGALTALAAGANDLGGVLMNESITRAAGGVNGQELGAQTLRAAIRSIGREPRQRTTLYAHVMPAAQKSQTAAGAFR
jgi:FO synthase